MLPPRASIASVVLLVALVVTSFPGTAVGDDAPDRPPNIVLVLTDDQGYADLGCLGARGFATPHLDALASEGLLFRSFYVSQPVCSASRASLLTGCYAERVGIQGALTAWDTVGLHEDEETLAELLKARGYATCAVGKWHLGHRERFLPLHQGFDEFLGLPYSNDMWPVEYDGERLDSGAKLFYPELPLLDGDRKVAEIRTLADQATLTARYTARALDFIERNSDRPFFLYVAHSMPHVPLGVSEAFRGSSEQGPYGDVIQEIDDSVGQLLRALERHGLEERTVFVFLSDNGPWLNFGKHAGSARPLREGKGTTWEGGVRVPCVMRWPGVIAPGRVCDEIAASLDLLPTLAAAAGAEPPTLPIDGVDLGPLLRGEASARPRDEFLYYDARQLQGIRQGRYKLVFPHTARSYVGVEPGEGGLPGPYASLDVGRALYDLQTDVGETTDVAAAHPEVVARLEKRAARARRDLGDRLQGIEGEGRREPGRIGHSQPSRVEHLAVGRPLTLGTAYTKKYAGGGDGALVDGRCGSSDFLDGTWQGYEALDVAATVDLGAPRPVSEITLTCLESQPSWIFLPKSVEIAVSTDGVRWETVLRQAIETPTMRPMPAITPFRVALEAREVRYVRVRAETLGVCPAWHPGAGGKPWIFADEIVVR